MTGQKTLPKLTPDQQNELCGLLAAGYNCERASDYFLETYGIKLSRQNIHKNYVKNKKWQAVINRLVGVIDQKIIEHPLAHKMNRLNIIQEALNESFTWRLDKVHFSKLGRKVSEVYKKNVGNVASLIREARIEIEGESLGIKGNVTHDHFFNQIVKKAADRRRKAQATNG